MRLEHVIENSAIFSAIIASKMSLVTDNADRIQADGYEPQADLLTALKNDDYAQFEYILKNHGNHVDIDYSYEGPDCKTLLEIACSCKKKSKFVERLLASGAAVNALNEAHGKAPIHLVVLYSDFETLKLLVENPDIDINFPDKDGNTVLHYAVQLDDRQTISLLLASGADMGVRNSNGDLAAQFTSSATLEYLLDGCISTRGQPLDADYQLVFDYGMLACKQPPVRETELLAAISRVRELRPLLEHPVLTSFLHLKWQNVTSCLYWRILLIHALFLITVTTYIMGVYVPQTMFLTSGNGTLFEGPTSWSDEMRLLPDNYTLWRWLALLLGTLILFREVVKLLFYSKCEYFKEVDSYLKLASIGATYVTLHTVSGVRPLIYEPDIKSRCMLAAVTIFLTYLQLALLISQHPVAAISVYQFKKEFFTYTKVITWSAAFILAFVISFYILFTEWDARSYDRYTVSNVSVQIIRLAFKTPEIYTGQWDFHYFLLGCYFVCVTVTLFGLVNTVSVTNAMNINAKRVKFVSQAKFVVNIEKSAPDLVSLLSALNGWYWLLIQRRLLQRAAEPSAASPSTKKLYVYVNQNNRIVAKNMQFDEDKTTYCYYGSIWSVSKSSIEAAKKIVSERGQKCGGSVQVAGAVAELQNRLVAVERALKEAEERQESLVEATAERMSWLEMNAESLKTIDDRLQNAANEAGECAAAEIRRFLQQIVPRANAV